MPKTRLGISVWAHLLLQKYEYQLPLNRSLKQLAAYDLSLAVGTITEGFSKILPLLLPVYEAIVTRSLSATHWHADETGWKVFEALAGKKNTRWFLWIFQSEEAVVYKICPSRSSKVLVEHFGQSHGGGCLSVDRYSAYKAIAKTQSFLLAFCWAHVRRDFLSHAKGYPEQESWALEWVKRIGTLYHLNNQRLPFKRSSPAFVQHHQELVTGISVFREQLDNALQDEALRPGAKKLMVSLDNHWDGLSLFVDDPSIPMDNNTAERGLRHAVLGRNNYYGSGAIWSSVLTSVMFTLLQTMKKWEVNVHTWLLAYFYECTAHQGQPPDIIDKFLPWNMTDEQKALFARPPEYEDSS